MLENHMEHTGKQVENHIEYMGNMYKIENQHQDSSIEKISVSKIVSLF
jgi:hypothetical protein